MFRPTLACLGLALFVLACDGGSSSTSTAAKPVEATPTEATPTEATPTEATPTEAKPTEATPTEAKPSEDGKTRAAKAKAAVQAKPDQAKASRASLSKLLNDGRAAVKNKQLDEGIALYREALKIDPVNPKVLGELGFAAYKKGQLDLAESSTHRAIDLTPPDGQGLGALYYNLGLIAEARSDLGAAKAAYARSLEVRPGNEIVAAKLAKLDGAKLAKGPSTAADSCKEIMANLECVGSEAELAALPADEQDYMGVCTCTVQQQLDEGTGKSAIEAAAILALEGSSGYGGGYENELYLALKVAGHGWLVHGQVVNGYTPGAFGISNEGKVETFEFDDLGPAPGNELRLVTWQSELDMDMGPNILNYYDGRTLLLCEHGGDGAFHCGATVFESSSGAAPLIDSEPYDPADISDLSWKVEIAFTDGQVEVKIVSGADEVPDRFKQGPRPLSDFIRMSAAG